MPWGVVEQVTSAHYLGNVLRGIVDHNSQLIRIKAITTFEDKIADIRGDNLSVFALSQIPECNFLVVC